MKNISLETGKVEYLLGGKVSVRFNPTDLNYMERVYAAFDELGRIQTRFQTDLEALEEEKEIFALAKETDGKIREVLNALFEKEVCEPLFGNMNLFAYSGGMPVWVNLMLAVSDVMNTAMQAEADARDKRIEKYVKKVQKKEKPGSI